MDSYEMREKYSPCDPDEFWSDDDDLTPTISISDAAAAHTAAHTADYVPGEADPEWRHWAKAEIQRLTALLDSLPAPPADLREFMLESVRVAESNKDLALAAEAERDGLKVVSDLAIETADLLKSERDRARDLAARLSEELGEQAVEWGYRTQWSQPVWSCQDEVEARSNSHRTGRRVVSRKVGPWTEEA